MLSQKIKYVKEGQFCPCGRPKKYSDCCAKPHQNVANAKTAEDLMRSRYVAFTVANGDYLMESHHSKTKDLIDKVELISWAKTIKWLKLEIINTVDGGEEDAEGIVEFKAYIREGSKKDVMHQRGKFLREFGHWVYFDLAE